MNEVWDLERLYKGFDDPAFEADLTTAREKSAGFSAFAAQLADMEPAEGLRQGIRYQEELTELAGKMINYAMLRQAANSQDAEAASQVGRLMAVFSGLAAPEAAFKAWATKLPDLMDLVKNDAFLAEYEFLFANMSESSRHLLPGRGEEIMAKMRLSGSSAWSDLHGYLTSTLPVEYNGGITNLSGIRNLAYDGDPAVRKAAYEAELASYERIKDSVAFALNSIKLETISSCQLRGYESPLARTLKNSNMEKATLDAMMEAIDEYLPKFWQYLKAKGKALGHEKGLPWYDLFAPMGRSTARYTIQETRDYLVERFSGFDEELAGMIAQAFDDAWIDFYPREGKAGGAFCAGIEGLKNSRILTNFNGTFMDITILAHELGHAFHNRCVSGHRPLNQDYSMPLAETASTFNECVITGSAIADAADKEEKLALIDSQLQAITQVICDINSRYRFESAVFANRQEKFMDAAALCEMMTEAQKHAYGDGLDQEFLHPYMWICKSHYYGPSFYNFPYSFGALFSRGLYAQYEKEGSAFVARYKKLLHTTPVASAEDVAKVAGIDLTDKAFWRSALQTVADQIDLFCQLLG